MRRSAEARRFKMMIGYDELMSCIDGELIYASGDRNRLAAFRAAGSLEYSQGPISEYRLDASQYASPSTPDDD
jgi:hypothetical protein